MGKSTSKVQGCLLSQSLTYPILGVISEDITGKTFDEADMRTGRNGTQISSNSEERAWWNNAFILIKNHGLNYSNVSHGRVIFYNKLEHLSVKVSTATAERISKLISNEKEK